MRRVSCNLSIAEAQPRALTKNKYNPALLYVMYRNESHTLNYFEIWLFSAIRVFPIKESVTAFLPYVFF